MINWDRINELRQEVGEEDLAEVLVLFCEEVEEVLDQLDTVLPDAMPSQLHFLKGSALNIGLTEVGKLCRTEEEKLARDSAANAEIPAIRAAYLTAKEELQNLLAD